MDFFDKLGKKASEAYKITADKTGKLAKETKLKFKIGELKGQINDIYEEIGKKVYEKHIREEEICIKKDLEEQCTRIDVLSSEIDNLLKECLELKNQKQCPKCYKQIDKEAKFCPYCGEKQETVITKEAEILEDVENTKVEEDQYIENQMNIDDVKENSDNKQEYTNKDSKEDLERTIEVESAVDKENNN